MDEQLRQALERAAAAEKEKRPAPRVRKAKAWWADLAAEREAEVARNWRGTLQWIADGKASRDAAVAAFLDTFGDAALIEQTEPFRRTKTIMLIEAELATALSAGAVSPHLLDAYRLYVRRQAGGSSDGEQLLALRREMTRLAARKTSSIEKRDRARVEAEKAQTELDALLRQKNAEIEAVSDSSGWFGRLSGEARKALDEIDDKFKTQEVRLKLLVAEATSAAEMADGEQLIATEELRGLRTKLAALEHRQKTDRRVWFEPLGIERGEGDPVAMVQVPAGRFWMGTADTGDKRTTDEVPLRRVELSRGFRMATVPVTQAMFTAVMGYNPARHVDPLNPVERVDWYEALRFCNALSALCGRKAAYHIGPGAPPTVRWRRDADGYRLPTEAEWERAARGNGAFEFAGSDDPERVAWYRRTSGNQTHPVGRKSPNDLGIFDLSGNVFEWCWDGYDADIYRTSEPYDPCGPDQADARSVRGGSAAHDEHAIRVTARSSVRAGATDVFLGFRVVRNL